MVAKERRGEPKGATIWAPWVHFEYLSLSSRLSSDDMHVRGATGGSGLRVGQVLLPASSMIMIILSYGARAVSFAPAVSGVVSLT